MKTGFFSPAKRNGLLFHISLLVILLILSTWAFWSLSQTEAGPQFVVFLIVGIVTFAPIPLLGYQAYALFRARYVLDRNSLELRWGLRDETIPLADVEWVRYARDLTQALPLPPVRMPGAILGLRRHRELGIVEYMAGATKDLLLVATTKRVYAISPADPTDFVQTFSRAVELGSLREARARSIYPSFVIVEAWRSGLVRYLWLAALFLNVGLIAWVSLLIPALPRVALGLRPDRTPDAVPSLQLVILPLLSVLLNLAGWSAGLFLYRWPKRRVISLLLWGSGALNTLLLLLAVLFIVGTPV